MEQISQPSYQEIRARLEEYKVVVADETAVKTVNYIGIVLFLQRI